MLKVQALNKELVSDFYKINCDANGLGWCSCVAWWCTTWDEFKERTAEQNKAQREQLFSQDEFDGYLLYLNNEPIGWSQCGPTRRLTKLCNMYNLPSNSDSWAITCFSLVPSARGKGYAEQFLNLIVKDLKLRGIKYVQGFPIRNTEDPWTGPENIFRSSGFRIEQDHQKLPIYGLDLR